jgi:hypothetical protein
MLPALCGNVSMASAASSLEVGNCPPVVLLSLLLAEEPSGSAALWRLFFLRIGIVVSYFLAWC